MEKIYLASKSPRRAELLARLNIPFEVISAEVDESVWGSPEECVCELAQRKAAAGAERIGSGWVLAADTLVFFRTACRRASPARRKGRSRRCAAFPERRTP